MNPNKPVNRKTRLRWNRSFVLVASVLVLLLGIVGASLAYLSMKTPAVKNEFTYGKVSCEVLEDFDGTVKNDVRIKNTGNIPAFIRARVVVTWKAADGSIYGAKPIAGTDYSFLLPGVQNGDWLGSVDENGNPYYYCCQPVASNQETPALISNCRKLDNANVPEGYDLSVEILADAIQSEPAGAVEEAWGVTVENGVITSVSGN